MRWDGFLQEWFFGAWRQRGWKTRSGSSGGAARKLHELIANSPLVCS